MSAKPKVLRAAPPVSKRPRCPDCGKRLRPVIHREHKLHVTPEGVHTYPCVSSGWTGYYHGFRDFCTLRCAAEFGSSAWRSGSCTPNHNEGF